MGDFFLRLSTLENFFDEMFAGPGVVRPHYEQIARAVQGNARAKNSIANARWPRPPFFDKASPSPSTTTTRGRERIFPFDLVPRIIPGRRMGTDRARARPANHGAESVSARHLSRAKHSARSASFPKQFVWEAAHFRPEFMHFDVPQEYLHSHLRDRSDPRSATATISCSKTTRAALPAFPT